ncbi:MAG: hypothetical protein ING19_10485, partial [Azospirillum sp.]|nr:hypothetical protein [Azospirillum sp.]
MWFRTVAGLALAGLAFVGISGFGTASAQETPRRGGEMIFAVGGEPDTTDCHAATNFAVIHHLAPHYSTLVRFNATK